MSSTPLDRLSAGLSPRARYSGELTQAAVLVVLDELSSPLSVVLTRRADHLRLHAGEAAFPGGKCDPGDSSHWDTAAREAHEEVGLPESHLRRLGQLDAVVTRTGIEVVPCIAELTEPAAMVPNPEELAAVYEVPLDYFASPAHLYFDERDYGGVSRRVPRYEWQEHSIWGITAAILVRLVNITYDAGLPLPHYWQGKAEPS